MAWAIAILADRGRLCMFSEGISEKWSLTRFGLFRPL